MKSKLIKSQFVFVKHSCNKTEENKIIRPNINGKLKHTFSLIPCFLFEANIYRTIDVILKSWFQSGVFFLIHLKLVLTTPSINFYSNVFIEGKSKYIPYLEFAKNVCGFKIRQNLLSTDTSWQAKNVYFRKPYLWKNGQVPRLGETKHMVKFTSWYFTLMNQSVKMFFCELLFIFGFFCEIADSLNLVRCTTDQSCVEAMAKLEVQCLFFISKDLKLGLFCLIFSFNLNSFTKISSFEIFLVVCSGLLVCSHSIHSFPPYKRFQRNGFLFLIWYFCLSVKHIYYLFDWFDWRPIILGRCLADVTKATTTILASKSTNQETRSSLASPTVRRTRPAEEFIRIIRSATEKQEPVSRAPIPDRMGSFLSWINMFQRIKRKRLKYL